MALLSARLAILRLNAGRLDYARPSVPHSPSPSHNSLAGPTYLTWQSDGSATAYDLTFTDTTTGQVFTGSTPDLWWVLGPLFEGHHYEWSIVARSPLGDVSGPVWAFTAAKPHAPTTPSPVDGALDVPLDTTTLTWVQPAGIEGGTTYDVYFGTVAGQLSRVSVNQSATSYTPPPPLEAALHYYWRIVARNGVGETSSPTWTFETFDPTRLFVTIGGDVPHMRIADFSVRDLLADTPNTCDFTVDTDAPLLGQEVRIGLGSLAAEHVLFSGIIDTVNALYEGLPVNRAWRVTCQDHHYGLNRRKVRIRYSQQSATVIALDLLAKFALSNYTGTHVAQGLPVVEGGIDFTDEDLTACFARLATRIGGYWYVDYEKDVHLFLVEQTDAPEPLRATTKTLMAEPSINHDRDLTQVRTRVFVEGGGSEARSITLPGATSLPVTDASWYAPTGGLVVSGPQRIAYTGKGVVGGPAAPSAAPLLLAGGLASGPYSYVYTHVVNGVETPLSAPSPPVTIPGVAYPTTAPTATPVLTGVSPPSVSLTSATPIVSRVDDATTAPTVGVTGIANPPASQINPISTFPGPIPPGTYTHVCTYETTLGETGIDAGEGYESAIGIAWQQNIGAAGVGDGRITGLKIYRSKGLGGLPPYFYVATAIPGGWVNDNKLESQLGAQAPTTNATGAEGRLTPNGSWAWAVTFVVSGGGETAIAAWTWFTLPAGYTAAHLTQIPISPNSRVIARRIYRHAGQGTYAGQWKLEETINNNTATAYHSVKADSELGAAPPASNTTGTGGLVPGSWYAWQVTFATSSGETTPGAAFGQTLYPTADAAALAGIPTSLDGRVTKRKLYRTASGGGAYRLEATINDNTTTTYTSTKADGALGEVAPTTNDTGTGDLTQNTTYYWWVRFVTNTGGHTWMSSANVALYIGGNDSVDLTNIPTSADGRVTKRDVFRAGGTSGAWRLEVTINDNTTTTYRSVKRDDQLGAELINTDTTTANAQIQVSGITLGPAGTTNARKLYRTTSGGSAYLLVTTIPDNLTTVWSDDKSDASLGGTAPGDEVVELIGIPASGAGAILYEIRQGDEVNLVVQVDDAAAQAELAAIEGPPSQGIIEHCIQDRRLGLSEATATGKADLKLFARPLVTIHYATRDPKTRSGKTITIDLPELGLTGDFTIQTVEMSEIGISRGLWPKCVVTASSVRFSLEDVIRRLKLEDV